MQRIEAKLEVYKSIGWLKKETEELDQEDIFKEACVNPTRQEYQTPARLGKQDQPTALSSFSKKAQICTQMSVAAELGVHTQSIASWNYNSPTTGSQYRGKGWGQGTQEPPNIQSLLLFLKTKAIFYFKITFNYKCSISTFKNMQFMDYKYK